MLEHHLRASGQEAQFIIVRLTAELLPTFV